MLAVLVIGIVALTRSSTSPPNPSGRSPTAATGPTPSPAAELELALGHVTGRSTTGRTVHVRALRAPAAAIRRTMTELYSIGFVDPSAWDGGRYSSLFRLFAPDARGQAHRDLAALTLGRTQSELSAVVPRRAKLDLRFLTDAGQHPAAAFATVEFTGVGIAGDVHVPIAQDGAFTLRKLAGGWRVEGWRVRSRVPAPSKVRAKVRTATFTPGVPGGGLLFILAIGSDARPGQGLATRGDSLHIIGVNPKRGAASVVGIPRDSWVEIPGHGMNKINSALADGGPQLMVQTVERLSGIHIDGYALTGFADFVKMVNAIGGVDVTIPYPMNDPYSHAHFRPGPAHLNGRSALAFGRDRHDVPGGDLGRSLNQGRLLIGAFQQLRTLVLRDPANVIPWLIAGARFMHTDLSLDQLLQLALATATIDPKDVGNAIVPGGGAVIGGQDVILLGSQARAIFADQRADAILHH